LSELLFRTLVCFHKVFPEDQAVPVAVFDALAPLWAGRETKRAHLKIRSWITALIQCSLAKGNLAAGVFQHDIVRHFVITRHSDEQLKALQQRVLDELLAARPSSGFTQTSHMTEGSLEKYVSHNLWWHIRGALGDAAPPMSLVDHEDRAILESVALALGKGRIETTVHVWVEEGRPLDAAKLAWVGSMLASRGVISSAAMDEFVFLAAGLLAANASDATVEFETNVLTKAFSCDVSV